MSERLSNLSKEKYIAGMVLSAVGDALGYKNGEWEFCSDGLHIHSELQRLGGLDHLAVKLPEWRVSDDTIMHLATARALVRNMHGTEHIFLFHIMAEEYKACMLNMQNRAPGLTCMKMCERLDPNDSLNGLLIPFSPSGGGCGAAMRSMCIGLRYPYPDQIDDLIAVSIEAGRLTHHHPTGYLGSLASALFASYAVQNKPVHEWGNGLMVTLNQAKKFISKSKLYSDKDIVKQNIDNWNFFQSKWNTYLDGQNYSNIYFSCCLAFNEIKERDAFYRRLSYDGVGGASGHDAPMIAYDALLACDGDWEKLCKRAMFHGGDSDSTGVIAGCLYGILYGFGNVSKCNFENVELYEELKHVGEEIFSLATDGNVNLSMIRVDERNNKNSYTHVKVKSNGKTQNTYFIRRNFYRGQFVGNDYSLIMPIFRLLQQLFRQNNTLL